jgi:hypothetical protein
MTERVSIRRAMQPECSIPDCKHAADVVVSQGVYLCAFDALRWYLRNGRE